MDRRHRAWSSAEHHLPGILQTGGHRAVSRTESLKMTARFPRTYRTDRQRRDRQTATAWSAACARRPAPRAASPSDGEKPEGSKKKVLTTYILDFTKCWLCGSCVESCNFDAIHFSKDYNLASTRQGRLSSSIFSNDWRKETLMQTLFCQPADGPSLFSAEGFVGLVFLLTVGLIITGGLIACQLAAAGPRRGRTGRLLSSAWPDSTTSC